MENNNNNRYSREIIFRGKDVNGNWHYGSLDTRESGVCYIGGVAVLGSTVGQYVGAKDENGIRIFEGDVVAARSWHGVIAFDTDDFSFSVALNRNITFGLQRPITVLGNIYDNNDEFQELADAFLLFTI